MTLYNIHIMSYPEFLLKMKELGYNDSNIDSEDVAIISICNTDGTMVHHFKEQHENVLNIDFDDCISTAYQELGYYAITERQAETIVEFFQSNADKHTVYIHCEAGISRSAGVGYCLCDYLRSTGIDKSDITLHLGYRSTGNSRVVHLIHQAMMKI